MNREEDNDREILLGQMILDIMVLVILCPEYVII